MLGERFHRTLVSLLDLLRSTFHTGRRDLRTIFRVKTRDSGGVVFVPLLDVCGGKALDLLPVVLIDLLGGCGGNETERGKRHNDRRAHDLSSLVGFASYACVRPDCRVAMSVFGPEAPGLGHPRCAPMSSLVSSITWATSPRSISSP